MKNHRNSPEQNNYNKIYGRPNYFQADQDYFLAGLAGADPFVLPAGGVLGISWTAFNSPTAGTSLTTGDDETGGVVGDVTVGVLGWACSTALIVTVGFVSCSGSGPGFVSTLVSGASKLLCNSMSATLDIFRSLLVTVTVDTGDGVTAIS